MASNERLYRGGRLKETDAGLMNTRTMPVNSPGRSARIIPDVSYIYQGTILQPDAEYMPGARGGGNGSWPEYSTKTLHF